MTASKGMAMAAGGVMGLALAVGALWVWQHAGAQEWVQAAQRPEIAAWAVRSGAVAGGALAQLVWVVMVADRVYGRDLFGRLLRWGSGLAAGGAAVSAVVLGLAGR
jgi:hypothetical protein